METDVDSLIAQHSRQKLPLEQRVCELEKCFDELHRRYEKLSRAKWRRREPSPTPYSNVISQFNDWCRTQVNPTDAPITVSLYVGRLAKEIGVSAQTLGKALATGSTAFPVTVVRDSRGSLAQILLPPVIVTR